MQFRPYISLSGAFLGAFLISSCHSVPAQGAATEKLYLSGTDKDHTVAWDFMIGAGRGSGKWTTIAVPSNWETQGFGTYTPGWNKAPGEQGHYKHSFHLPLGWAGKQIFLVFEGAMTDTQVLVNGQSAGAKHQGGFTRFKYDVTPYLKSGESNLLEVTLDKDSADPSVNRAERDGDYWTFGGIYRPVYLEAVPAQSIRQTAIHARADGLFSLTASIQGQGDADRLTAQILTLDGKKVGAPMSVPLSGGGGEVVLQTQIARPLLWSAEAPNRYQVQMVLRRGNREIHRVNEKFGFRTIEVRPKDGIYLNGRKIIFKGAPRHSFWPTSGRALSPALNRADVLLMKEMNMNAVLTAHYPPDREFLESCDELGLYVLDELPGWQKKYDTAIGRPLVREMVERDVNHPSVVFWCNANEGGWNTELDGDFALYDPQKRAVLHPWALSGGVQTDHYENYDSTRAYLAGEKGGDIFMPTEFLHGLYDGGAGAGLSDYWKLMQNSPLSAGGFIWVLADEGLVRDDRNGAIDVVGNNYPDGIVGPFHEKEGSFFSVKEIWSPLQLAERESLERGLPDSFDGRLKLTNFYAFTDTKNCRFAWSLIRFNGPNSPQSGHEILSRGAAKAAIAPGATGTLALFLPGNWRGADALVVAATDPAGHEVSRWVLPIKSALEMKNRVVKSPASLPSPQISEDADGFTLAASGTSARIGKTTGQLMSVKRGDAAMALSNGPVLAAGTALGTAALTGISSSVEGDMAVVRATYSGNLAAVVWKMHPDGWLELEVRTALSGPQDFMGVSFDLPEKQVQGIKWLGRGPYRVWKNRMRGPQLDVWSKAYNDTATGAATGADGWVYPEFKGYYADMNWAVLQTTSGKVTVVTPDQNVFLRLFTPRNGPDPRTAVAPFPSGDISFLDGISPIGNKFDPATNTGPEGQPNIANGEVKRTLFFKFSSE